MSGELRSFDFEGKSLRTAMDAQGNPLFNAKDACELLRISKYRDAIAQLDEGERVSEPVDTPGGRQQMIYVTEPGFWELVFISRHPEAKRVKRWLAKDVMPSLRKTGAYVAPSQPGDEAFVWLPMTEAASRAGVGRTALQYRCAQFGIPTRKAGPFCLVPWEQVEKHFAEHPIRADRGRHAEAADVSGLGTVVDLLTSVLEIYGPNQARSVLHGIDPGRFPHPAPQGGAQ